MCVCVRVGVVETKGPLSADLCGETLMCSLFKWLILQGVCKINMET